MSQNEQGKYEDHVLDNLLESVKFLYTALHYIKELDEPLWQRANQSASDYQPDLNIVFEGMNEDDTEDEYGED
jgi:hypothetical protein